MCTHSFVRVLGAHCAHGARCEIYGEEKRRVGRGRETEREKRGGEGERGAEIDIGKGGKEEK